MSESIKTAELRGKTLEDLAAQLIEQKEARFKERMQMVTGTSTQIHEQRNTKRNIARIKTVMNELVNEERVAKAAAGNA